MPYGYGTGFIRATSDIPIRTLRLPDTSPAAGTYTNLRRIGTTTNYQVPTDKTGLVALIRVLNIDSSTVGNYTFGYADDASGSNFVGLATLVEMGLSAPPVEGYWVFTIPSGKFVGFRNTGTTNASSFYRIIVVLFEV
jgi:hypothetical protein